MEKLAEAGRVPWPGQGPFRTAVATAPGDRRDEADAGFVALGRGSYLGSGWAPGWALTLEP